MTASSCNCVRVTGHSCNQLHSQFNYRWFRHCDRPTGKGLVHVAEASAVPPNVHTERLLTEALWATSAKWGQAQALDALGGLLVRRLSQALGFNRRFFENILQLHATSPRMPAKRSEQSLGPGEHRLLFESS